MRSNNYQNYQTREWQQKVNQICAERGVVAPTVYINPRLKKARGYYWSDHTIEINKRLADFDPDEAYKCLMHELAHHLAYLKIGRINHGSTFKHYNFLLGGSHGGPSYADKWKYTCPCGRYFFAYRRLSVDRVNRSVCRTCKTDVIKWKVERIYAKVADKST